MGTEYPESDASVSTAEGSIPPSADMDKLVPPSWRGRVWDTFDLPPAERRLMFKVDAVILTFASLGYFLKNLDQQNVNNAFLSGMKEDLNMYGNQLVTAVSIWTVGYVLGQIPTNLLLTRVNARWVIPSLELGWSIVTLATYGVKSYKTLYVCRFLVGLFESGFYPGMHYLLGGWYTPRELGKRSMIFWLAGTLGNMFSGFLQTATYNGLSGRHGLAGWRWLFIVDAIISLPVASLGFFFLPGSPLQDKKVWWLSEEDHALARTRMQATGKKGPTQWTRAKFKRFAGSWHTYMLPLLYIIWNNGGVQQPMGYWLKSFNRKPHPRPGTTFSIGQINTLPLPGSAILIVLGLAAAWLSDGLLRGRRWPFIYFNAVSIVILAAILVNFPLYEHIYAHYALYWLTTGTNLCGPLIFAWINEICAADTEKRALLVALGNDLAYVVQAIAPNFIWKTTAFPAAIKGYKWSISLNAGLVVWTFLIQMLLRRDRNRQGKRDLAPHNDELERVEDAASAPSGETPGLYEEKMWQASV